MLSLQAEYPVDPCGSLTRQDNTTRCVKLIHNRDGICYQERRELLSKATLSASEHSKALQTANSAIEQLKEQLRLEKEGSAKRRIELMQVSGVRTGSCWPYQVLSRRIPFLTVYAPLEMFNCRIV